MFGRSFFHYQRNCAPNPMVYVNFNLRPTLKVVRFGLWGTAPHGMLQVKIMCRPRGAACSVVRMRTVMSLVHRVIVYVYVYV